MKIIIVTLMILISSQAFAEKWSCSCGTFAFGAPDNLDLGYFEANSRDDAEAKATSANKMDESLCVTKAGCYQYKEGVDPYAVKDTTQTTPTAR